MSEQQRERRTVAGQVELRATAGEPTKLVGYAAVFNEETVIGSWFRERIAPGAFADAIARPDDVRAHFNHEPNLILGRNAAGTLTLEEDARGLKYEITLPETSYARDLAVSVERGDVTQSSFMFAIDKDDDEDWDYSETKAGKLPLRTVKAVTLYDVSPVVFPAYESTTVSARALVLKDDRPTVPDHAAEHLAALLDLDEASA
uniref:Putative peptidase n=1 Tax=viral metagenome TaxID=1070528 RepID=A0A6M3J6J5_9ZZZZ